MANVLFVHGSAVALERVNRVGIYLFSIKYNSTTEERYNILFLGSLLVNAPKAKHRQGLRLVTFEITGTFSRSSVVSKRIVH